MRFGFWRCGIRLFAHSANAPQFSWRFSSQLVVASNFSTVSTVKSEKFGKKRQQQISDFLKVMASPDVEEKLQPLRDAVKESGDLVRHLKTSGAAKNEVDRAVHELKARKKQLADKELELAPKEIFVDRIKLEDLLKRRFFYDQSFAIYGGVTGLYDFGPMGCALKTNMIQYWRKHFILEESMLEVECTSLTPEQVLKASGHVDRFIDWMVKDVKTGECFRADHLIKNAAEELLKNKKTPATTKQELEDVLIKLDGFSNSDMHDTIVKYGFKSPITKNDLTEPVSFNLMFPTQIGPIGENRAYLRPETAQGIFINFKRLLEFNQGRLPFAAAQIGSGFRNEISPRQGLIRVREFTMCEIEHFLDPKDKNFPGFARYADLELSLYSACDQMSGKPSRSVKIGDAVREKVVDNETLGYYMARTYLFLVAVGVDPKRLRFRQHMSNEMAHYAQDCWDAECLTSYGWIECVGNADRSCYDLQAHARVTNERLTAEKPLAQPIKEKVVKVTPNKAEIGKKFKSDAKLICEVLNRMKIEEAEKVESELKTDGQYTLKIDSKEFQLADSVISVVRSEETRHVEEITPSVVEPSFGIGRIMYVVLEHSFRQREGDEQRNYLELPPLIAPVKCSVLPISAAKNLEPLVQSVREQLTEYGLSFKVDDSVSSIGRRYARTDEIGIPFGVTVDFESEQKPHTVTLRHAPSMEQVRMKIEEVGPVVAKLVSGKSNWTDVTNQFPRFTAAQN
ncbi:Diadenosine tetraphosphate synthetase [Aphelenchoides besseyi]|nr:Diadenosine tetraphosphate synthetase [Aphelenchoides besseyi]KAI6216795.1 Diadenosine tetraphosphate synthetase [Aphelenchoides besseyi]